MKKLTDDELILGITKPEKKDEVSQDIFNSDEVFKIEIKDTEKTNFVNGVTIKNILPLSLREKFLQGEKEIVYKNFIIKLEEKPMQIEGPLKEETTPKKTVKKPIRKKVK
jgi:hypothetical protein